MENGCLQAVKLTLCEIILLLVLQGEGVRLYGIHERISDFEVN